MFRRLFLKLGWTSKVFLLWKPLLEREVISACDINPVTIQINTSHWVEQYPHQQVTISTVPQSGKAWGQVTVAWTVKVFTFHSHHSELLLLSVETVFTPSKSKLLSVISAVFQQHPRLHPAYLLKPSPQSSSGSFSGSLPQQKYPPSSAKVFTAEIP